MDVYLFHCRMLMYLIMGCCPRLLRAFHILLHCCACVHIQTHTYTHTHPPTGYPKIPLNWETLLTPGFQGRYHRAVFIAVSLEI